MFGVGWGGGLVFCQEQLK